MEIEEILKKFMDAEMQVAESAVQVIMQRQDAEAVTEMVIEKIRRMEQRPPLITGEVIIKALEGDQIISPIKIFQERPSEVDQRREQLKELSYTRFRPIAREYPSNVQVLKDITGKSYSTGNLNNFVKMFNHRLETISRILRMRPELANATSLQTLQGMSDRESVAVIAMVADKRKASTGSVLIELEDTTGKALAIVYKNDEKMLKKSDDVVTDEVIGVIGTVRRGDPPRIFVRDILWPEVPVKREKRFADIPVSAALISDLHIGSEKFLEESFMRFLRWLREGGESEKEMEVAGRVKYVVVAGDVVDGIGIYPEQDEELLIPDIYKQYEVAAKLLSELPDYITVIIAPGNHDAVRQAEPQPAILTDIAGPLYEREFTMVGNPAMLSVEGVHLLVYHGRSFDDLVVGIPGAVRQEPAKMMEKLLQKRHLSPVYGGKVLVSPEEKDWMVIDEVPDVFHCGHVHIYGNARYRDVLLVNSGTFQAMTIYMQKLGVNPTPGYVPIVDLKTHGLEVVSFA
ncbi:MAG: DNA-directed DNA polymerase II small subunit [Candidatus Hadarchaeales archaeon]